MKVSIDRIEEGIAVLVLQENPRGRILIPDSLLPPGCREGDVLSLTLSKDRTDTAAVKKRVSGLIDTLKMKR
jgi:hypothetical protein